MPGADCRAARLRLATGLDPGSTDQEVLADERQPDHRRKQGDERPVDLERAGEARSDQGKELGDDRRHDPDEDGRPADRPPAGPLSRDEAVNQGRHCAEERDVEDHGFGDQRDEARDEPGAGWVCRGDRRRDRDPDEPRQRQADRAEDDHEAPDAALDGVPAPAAREDPGDRSVERVVQPAGPPDQGNDTEDRVGHGTHGHSRQCVVEEDGKGRKTLRQVGREARQLARPGHDDAGQADDQQDRREEREQ